MLDLLYYNKRNNLTSKLCCHTITWNDQFHSLVGAKISPNLFCHQCKAYACSHSPCIDYSGMFFYPFSVIGKLPNASHPPISKVVMVSASTFNCISMHEDDDEFDTGKFVTRQALADAFNKMHCDFFGLEETRTVRREFQIPGYYCICSGCDNGNYGVELWIKIDSTIRVYDPLNDTYEYVDLSFSQFIVIHRDPRVLLVTTEILGCPVSLCVLHAPHQNHGTKAVKLFWSTFFQLLHLHQIKYDSLIIMGDLNQKFGSILSTSVGNLYPQKQGPGAHCIHDWLTCNSMCFPSTFHGNHDASPSHTYTHHTGSLHRIDYVCVPVVCLQYPCFTYTSDLGLSQCDDHRLSHCSFVCLYKPGAKTPTLGKASNAMAMTILLSLTLKSMPRLMLLLVFVITLRLFVTLHPGITMFPSSCIMHSAIVFH